MSSSFKPAVRNFFTADQGISGKSLETKLGFIRNRIQLLNLEEHLSEKIQMKLILLNPSLHQGQLLQKRRLKMAKKCYDSEERELDSEDYFEL